ncbi:proton-conducting transporter transmembrane domain-containing protein [Salinactinospora qingdaonensis]|uniref:NADH-quinone oxidoreductase subunit L n=1 Tax=Salinactinospora qingdaonensis TaxID=702744 RepID=A0ABP7FYR2_9ACTN
MAATLWTLLALPTVVGGGLLLAGRRADAVAAPAALAVAGAEVVLGGVVAGTRPAVTVPALPGIRVGAAVDGLSAVAVLTVAVVLLAVVSASVAEIGRGQARARFHGLLLVFAAAMLVTVTATDLVALLAAWEVMGATSYALIGFWWQAPGRARSAGVAFVTTRAGDVGLYLAAGAALAGGAAGLELAGLAGLAPGWRDAAVAGIVVAALGKSAQLPFSFWLSHAMVGPTPVSALLHSATMVAAGGYLLVRVQPALAATLWAGPVVAWVGVLTALALGAVAYAQRDIKQLLAASTCSQVGFVVLAAGVGAVVGGTAQFVAHAAVKTLLFLAVGAWLVTLGAQGVERLRGAARRYRFVGVTFAVGGVALAGVPPLAIWAAKDPILAAGLARSAVLYVVALAAVAVSAAYAAKAVAVVWARSGEEAEAEDGPRVALWQRVPLAGLAAVSIALGVVAFPVVAAWGARLLGVAYGAAPALWEIVVSGVVSVAVLAVAGWVHARAERARAVVLLPAGLVEWLHLERLAEAGVVRPVLALARGLAVVDDRVIDGGVRGCSAVVAGLARLADGRGELGLDRSIRAVAGAVRWLARLALRPQTGLVHQYYAQAVAVLLALVAVWVLLR